MSDLERRARERKTGTETVPGRRHNQRRDFQQMRDAYQWQILGDHKLRGVDVKVALAISLFLNRDDYEQEGKLHAWPAIDTIAKRTDVPERSVKRSIDRLALFGHLRLIHGGRGPGDPHHYIPQIKDKCTWPVDEVDPGGGTTSVGFVVGFSAVPIS